MKETQFRKKQLFDSFNLKTFLLSNSLGQKTAKKLYYEKRKKDRIFFHKTKFFLWKLFCFHLNCLCICEAKLEQKKQQKSGKYIYLYDSKFRETAMSTVIYKRLQQHGLKRKRKNCSTNCHLNGRKTASFLLFEACI